MDLKQLRAFVTVAETGNVTRASSLLNLVQPAVAPAAPAREDMGTELFDRSRHGMQLTSSGKTMLNTHAASSTRWRAPRPRSSRPTGRWRAS